MFGWTPGIGDPTIYGWVTVAAYAAGTICCWFAAERGARDERRFWLMLTAIMAFLCINKQLDLQSLLTNAGRFEAKAHGWYDVRRKSQVAFIFIAAILATTAAAALLWRARRASTALRGATLGLIFLMLFVVIRASSFEKVDWFINLHLAGVRANHVMELGGIAVVTAFAVMAARTAGLKPAT